MDSKEEKSTSAPEAASKKDLQEHPHIKKVMSLESLVFFIIVAALFGLLGTRMGAINMINTMMQTAYQLLLDTVFYIMAIAVLAGALSGLFTEFGIVAILHYGHRGAGGRAVGTVHRVWYRGDHQQDSLAPDEAGL